MSMRKVMKDGNPAKGDVQNFKGAQTYECIRPMNTPMPMSNPKSLKMAQGNTFHGMPAYPNQYIFEGIVTPEPRVTSVYKNE